MLYIYQLGYSKEENIRLLEEQKIYELERTEFNSLSETTERLRKMKHDMQIYVDVINVLAKDKKWDELIAYTEQYHNTLATTQSAIATGNIAIDCILTAKLDYAENTELRQNILLWLLKIFRLILLSFHPYLEIYGIIPLKQEKDL